MHGEAAFAAFMQRRYERERQHGPARDEQSGGAAPRSRSTLRKPLPTDRVEEEGKNQGYDKDRTEGPCYGAAVMPVIGVRRLRRSRQEQSGEPQAQHGGMITAAIRPSTIPMANSAQASSDTVATSLRAGGSLRAENTRHDPSTPSVTRPRPTRVPTITIQGLPTRQSWKVASEPSWCARKKPAVPSARPAQGMKPSRTLAPLTAAAPSRSSDRSGSTPATRSASRVSSRRYRLASDPQRRAVSASATPE